MNYETQLNLIDTQIKQVGILLTQTEHKARLLDELRRLILKRNRMIEMELVEIIAIERSFYDKQSS